jgi:hypothetical protein
MIKRACAAGLMMGFLLVVTTPASAAFGIGDIVFDPTNLEQNIIQVAYLLQVIGLTTKDLASLTNIGPILNILAQTQGVMNDMQIILDKAGVRVEGWRQLTSSIPCSGTDLRTWNAQAGRWGLDSVDDARDILPLARRSINLVSNLMELLGMISGLFGTTSGLQSVSALTSVVAVKLDQIQSITLPYQQARLGEQQMAHVNHLSSICLRQQLFVGWGTRSQW